MVQQSSPVRQWIRLACNQVRDLNSLPLLHSPQQLAREGRGLWYNPNFINRQNIHLDLWSRHIHVHERQVPVVGSLPHAHWKAPTLWLSYQTNNKQEKQKELQEKWLSNRKSSIYLFFFFLISRSMTWKGRRPQRALIWQITVGLSDLASHLRMDGVILFYFGGTTVFHTQRLCLKITELDWDLTCCQCHPLGMQDPCSQCT